MARETRGLAKAAAAAAPPPSIKRKRRGSPTPPPVPTTKIILPSPNSLSRRAESSTSPSKPNGDHEATEEEHGVKRAKISLKLKRPVAEDKAAATKGAAAVVAEEKVKEEKVDDRGLSREIRQALTVVIKEMAVDLPPPINQVLTLWLPPDFEQKPENTLDYVLQQDGLTWEHLVNTLHVFCKNLLVPCNYPNPMPPTTSFHLPVPALPSHYPPHPIYAFCAGLYTLMAQISPSDVQIGTAVERWGLVQKVPNQSSSSVDNGDWFTANVDAREVDSLLAKLRKSQSQDITSDETLMEKLASSGERLGYANAVALQSAASTSPVTKRTLNESVIRKASLKAHRWKEIRSQRSGGFGNSVRSVRIPPMSTLTFAPTFGATYDSNHYFAGFYDTMDAMHEHARAKSWTMGQRGRPIETGRGYHGLLPVESSDSAKGKGKETIEDILESNNVLMEELQTWQELRVQKGKVDWEPEREQVVARELLESLTRLAGMVAPADLMQGSDSRAGRAHRLSQRLLQNNAPSIRGILDPRRPHAVHDSLTVRPKSAAAQPLGGAPAVASTPSPVAYPPRQSTMHQPPRQQPSYSSPNAPYRPPTPNYAYTSPFQQPVVTGNGGGLPSTQMSGQASTFRPPLAGPSGLRQSFGPQSPHHVAQR